MQKSTNLLAKPISKPDLKEQIEAAIWGVESIDLKSYDFASDPDIN